MVQRSELWLYLLSVQCPKRVLQCLGWELSCFLAEIENCNLCVSLGEKECFCVGGKFVYVPAHVWERVFVWKCVCVHTDALRLC